MQLNPNHPSAEESCVCFVDC